MGVLETVKVRFGDTFCLISKRDFDPDVHELYPGEEDPRPAPDDGPVWPEEGWNGDVTPLPEDFPGREALEEAGITSLEGVRAVEDLTEVDGIGPATAKKIRAALGDG